MQLEKMTAQVRPRKPWEAVDLGFMMVNRWWKNIALSWLALTLPIFIIINTLLIDHYIWAAIAFWWLKPIYERVPLHIISRTLFGEVESLREIMRTIPKLIFPHLIKMLTIHRLDPSRSFNLPIWQLEKLTGNARAERTRVLKKITGSNALGLTFMCLLIEAIIFSSLFALVYMFSPPYYTDAINNLFLPDNGEPTWWAGIAINSFIYITFFIVEPFYVAGGFALYINRRTQLEGWDIEIAFRQMAQRLTRINRFSSVAMLLIALAVGIFMAPAKQLSAKQLQSDETPSESIITNAEAKKTIDEIMARSEFKNTKIVKGWRNKNKKDEDKTKEETEEDSEPFQLPGLSLGIASIGEAILWILVVALIVMAVVLYLRWSPIASISNHKINKKLPKSLFGLEITPESLPDDVSQAAMDLWRSNNPLVALSLLYRGALTTLVHRDGINLKGSATEGDCIRAVIQHDKLGASGIDYFRELTTTWQYAAYAHRLPDETFMRDLSQRWPQFFGRQS